MYVLYVLHVLAGDSPLLQELGGDDLNKKFWGTVTAGSALLLLAVFSYVMSVRTQGFLDPDALKVMPLIDYK